MIDDFLLVLTKNKKEVRPFLFNLWPNEQKELLFTKMFLNLQNDDGEG